MDLAKEFILQRVGEKPLSSIVLTSSVFYDIWQPLPGTLSTPSLSCSLSSKQPPNTFVCSQNFLIMQGKCYIDCVKRKKISKLNINFIPLIYKFLPDISIYYYKFNFEKIILNICCMDIYLQVFTCVNEIEK